MWTTDQYGAAHEGYVGAVLNDGTEPEPAYLDPGSSANFHETREWWAYSGILNRPQAARGRGACSCGWRGVDEYDIDWDAIDRFTEVFPSTGPREAWHQHIADVDASTVPLPTEMAALLEQLDDQLTRLTDETPLAALTVVAILETLAKQVAPVAALYAENDGLSDEVLGQGLGVSPSDAKSRLLRYRLMR